MTYKKYESKSQMKRVDILKAGEKQMSRDELLANIDWVGNNLNGNATYSSLVMASVNSLNALRAVVELHKPEKFGQAYLCEACSRTYISYSEIYPCPTIQAIERELK